MSLSGHRTSFSLEDEFWNELKHIADGQSRSVAAVLADIDKQRDPETNLSSAIRIHVLAAVKAASD